MGRPSLVLPQRVAFAVTAVTLAALYLAAGAPTPLLVVYQRRWDFPAWQLTVAFAVYAVALLIALLVVGSLSDFVGRRAVIGASLAVEAVAMVSFLLAPSIGWLIAARAVQGVATGAATTAISAALVDLAPDGRKGLAGVINGIAPAGGLGLGALLAGIAVQISARPDTVVFAVLVAVMVAGTGAALLVPDEVPRSRGALASLLPHASVPPTARRAFAGSVPLLVAAWMLAGLFMGLIPTILATILGVHSGITDGFTAFLQPGAAALTGVLLGRTAPRSTVLAGGAAVFVGAVVITTGITVAWLPLLWLGGLIGGVGFGASFSGSVRTLTPLVAPAQRAEMFASVYVVAYLSFGVPVIVAGQLIEPVGLLPVVTVYAVVIAVLAAAGIVALVQQRRRPDGRAAADWAPGANPLREGSTKERTS